MLFWEKELKITEMTSEFGLILLLYNLIVIKSNENCHRLWCTRYSVRERKTALNSKIVAP